MVRARRDPLAGSADAGEAVLCATPERAAGADEPQAVQDGEPGEDIRRQVVRAGKRDEYIGDEYIGDGRICRNGESNMNNRPEPGSKAPPLPEPILPWEIVISIVIILYAAIFILAICLP